jgi:hypothetical protein
VLMNFNLLGWRTQSRSTYLLNSRFFWSLLGLTGCRRGVGGPRSLANRAFMCVPMGSHDHHWAVCNGSAVAETTTFP